MRVVRNSVLKHNELYLSVLLNFRWIVLVRVHHGGSLQIERRRFVS